MLRLKHEVAPPTPGQTPAKRRPGQMRVKPRSVPVKCRPGPALIEAWASAAAPHHRGPPAQAAAAQKQRAVPRGIGRRHGRTRGRPR